MTHGIPPLKARGRESFPPNSSLSASFHTHTVTPSIYMCGLPSTQVNTDCVSQLFLSRRQLHVVIWYLDLWMISQPKWFTKAVLLFQKSLWFTLILFEQETFNMTDPTFLRIVFGKQFFNSINNFFSQGKLQRK